MGTELQETDNNTYIHIYQPLYASCSNKVSDTTNHTSETYEHIHTQMPIERKKKKNPFNPFKIKTGWYAVGGQVMLPVRIPIHRTVALLMSARNLPPLQCVQRQYWERKTLCKVIKKKRHTESGQLKQNKTSTLLLTQCLFGSLTKGYLWGPIQCLWVCLSLNLSSCNS